MRSIKSVNSFHICKNKKYFKFENECDEENEEICKV